MTPADTPDIARLKELASLMARGQCTQPRSVGRELKGLAAQLSSRLTQAEAERDKFKAELAGLLPTGNAKADKAWDAGYEQGCLDERDKTEALQTQLADLRKRAVEAVDPFALTRQNWPTKRMATDADYERAAAFIAEEGK